MRVGITGGTGTVGTHVAAMLINNGHQVTILSRNPPTGNTKPGYTYALWNAEKQECDTNALQQLDAVIHLAGEPVAGKRWSAAQKEKIASSRVIGTRFLVDQLRQHAPNCKTMIAASAIGFYGPDSAPPVAFTEDAPAHNDFLGTICQQWEAEEHKADDFMRTVIIRIGLVMATEAGAFKEFVTPLSLGVMPILGSGRQVASWIHITDLARLMLFALDNSNMRGPYNAVAPHPVSNKELMKTVARIKGGFHIPAPAPSFLLQLMLGEMSIEVLKSCTVSAAKTLGTGFSYTYPDIDSAVKELLKK
jgi:uncharacterized protein (TIGR01777 family)